MSSPKLPAARNGSRDVVMYFPRSAGSLFFQFIRTTLFCLLLSGIILVPPNPSISGACPGCGFKSQFQPVQFLTSILGIAHILTLSKL